MARTRRCGEKAEAEERFAACAFATKGLIVKSEDRYFLLHALQTLHELLVNGIFAHNGYRDLPRSDGKSSISLPFGIYGEWLKGPDCPLADDRLRVDAILRSKSRQNSDISLVGDKEATVRTQCKWLVGSTCGSRRPVEIFPGPLGIPVEWLEEAAYSALDPSAVRREKLVKEHDGDEPPAKRPC